MTPSAAAAAAPRRRRRRRNNASVSAKGSGGASARALAAGLWRLRHAQRMNKADPSSSSAMEKATKWDNRSTAPCSSPLIMMLLEAELDKARGHIADLEDERRVLAKSLERFLRKLADDKARVRGKVAALRDDLAAERAHRRQLEQANARLMCELAEARSSARRQAESRKLMEEACSELTREVEEDQAEVELLRRECLRMREEMEEERRMLQMAEVWREERVQMKLCDARIALEAKYTQLNHLQAEMEAFVRRMPPSSSRGHAAEVVSSSRQNNHDDDDDDAVLAEHLRRRMDEENSPSASSSNKDPDSNVSPATDLFLAKIDRGSSADDMDYDGGRDSCSCLGTSDRSPASNGNGGFGEARSSGKNTALIRRLWRSAITESRNNKTGGGGSPSWDRRPRSSVTVEAEQGQQSLRDKLMEARMDHHKPPTSHRT